MAEHRRFQRPWKGLPTRGKTARNRLRRVDLFVSLYDSSLLCREDGAFRGAWFVDLGYGAEPFTTLEAAERLRLVHPGLRVLGVEIDRERVRAALPYADAVTQFRHGGFRLPLQCHADGRLETVRIVRAFNVFRQYPEETLERGLEELALTMLPGALLIEGTSDPFGRRFTANVFRRVAAGGFRHEALVFGARGTVEFDPAAFQAILPKKYIHRMVDGEPIQVFFEAWKDAAAETRAQAVFGPRNWFRAAAKLLVERGVGVHLRPVFLRHGFLVIAPP